MLSFLVLGYIWVANSQYAAVSSQGGYYRPHAYFAESRRMGLIVDDPDINQSRWRYYGHGRFVAVGFMAVKGLSRSGADMIIDDRDRRGEYTSLADFSGRVKLGRDDSIALCPAGVFDSIAQGILRTHQARALLKANTGTARKGQHDLFAGEPLPTYTATGGPSAVIAPIKWKTAVGELWEEYAALGFLRKLHPLALWKDAVLSARRIKAKRLANYFDRYVCLIGWPVTQKEVWTKDDLTMSFLTFEDETAIYETVIFPKVYDQYGKLLLDQMPLLVYGWVRDDHGAVTLEVAKVTPL